MTALRKIFITACVSILAVTTAIGMAEAKPHHRSTKPVMAKSATKAGAKAKARFVTARGKHARKSAVAKREAPNPGLNCVQFVKAVSDVELTGDAWMWWHRAEGVYERGAEPRKDAILVFKQSGKMTRGHVAQVTDIIDERNIRIDHSNWAPRGGLKGQVARDVVVQDISVANDWTLVRVWYDKVEQFGRPYPTYGFVYSPSIRVQSASIGSGGEALLHRASYGMPDAGTVMMTAPRGLPVLRAGSPLPDQRRDESLSGPQKNVSWQLPWPANSSGPEALSEREKRQLNR